MTKCRVIIIENNCRWQMVEVAYEKVERRRTKPQESKIIVVTFEYKERDDVDPRSIFSSCEVISWLTIPAKL